MQGWKIFTHSVRMIFGNLGAAFRISLVLYLVQVAVGVYHTSRFGDDVRAMQMSGRMDTPPGFWPVLLLVIVVSVITSLWIAVSWHRYVLLEENPSAVVPPFRGDQILSYLGKTILLGLLLAITGFMVGMILALVFGMIAGPVGVMVSVFLTFGLLVYLSYRFALVLPATAIGQPLTFAESLGKTSPASGAIIQLSVIAIGFAVLIELPQFMNADPNSIVNIIYIYVLGWITMMVGISILTTLYGVYVEGREL